MLAQGVHALANVQQHEKRSSESYGDTAIAARGSS
jgi:hypothetical protein